MIQSFSVDSRYLKTEGLYLPSSVAALCCYPDLEQEEMGNANLLTMWATVLAVARARAVWVG